MPLLRRADPAPPSTDVEPIRIATDPLVLVGSVAPAGQRVTDLLLRGQDVAFLPDGAEPTPDAWIRVAPSDILWVIPPPLRSTAPLPSPGRIRCFIRVGGYRIIGEAHLRPDTPLDDRLRASRPFLPLVNASIAADGAASPEDAEVVIVNLARASELRPLPG